MLCADGEAGAEIYGCALDRDQARKVFDTAARMVELSDLSKSITLYKAQKRLVHEKSGSFYEAVAADAGGNLGHNPHGIAFDEVLTQPSGDLWDAMKTGMGTRAQPLLFAATTAGQTDSWAYQQHKQMLDISEDPEVSPHTFVYLRNVPVDADPWDKENWKLASPALGSFFSLSSLEEEAIDARRDPQKEIGFRMFRLNQWAGQNITYIPMHEYDACVGREYQSPEQLRSELKGRVVWAGFDAASMSDLCAWSMLVLPDNPADPVSIIWRFWIPERAVRAINEGTHGRLKDWIAEGWIKVAGNAMLDWKTVYDDIAEDAENFMIMGIDFDIFATVPVAQAIADRCAISEDQMMLYQNTPAKMTPGIQGIKGMFFDRKIQQHGNPVARWNFEVVELKTSLQNPELSSVAKPDRLKSSKRVDGVPAAIMAWNAWHFRGNEEIPESAYADGGGLFVV